MQNKQFEYTLNMENIYQGKLSELKSYYCREDNERALSAVDKASKDSKKFRMRDLKRLCDARDINADAIVGDRTLLEQIPTRELRKKIASTLNSWICVMIWQKVTLGLMEKQKSIFIILHSCLR